MYNPFSPLSIHELDATALAALQDVPEGWYIEYKRDPCSPRNYAKEASAFANSHGGWIFVGLEEESDSRVPAGGPGIPIREATRRLDAARDSIAQNLSPAPHVELGFINGPIPELSIPEDHGVLVIQIPESTNTPHIHVTGRIYRRRSDAAQPSEITNRAELDDLYNRHQQRNILIDNELNLGFDEAWTKVADIPWLHIAFIPETPRPAASRAAVNLDKFRQTIISPSDSSAPINLQLPNIYTTSLGFVARNNGIQDNPSGAATALEYSAAGGLYLSIPLGRASTGCSDSVDFLANEQGNRFKSLLRSQNHCSTPIFDGTDLAFVLWGLSIHITSILKALGGDSTYFLRIKFRNIFRTIPFFDSPIFLDWCEAYQLPIIHRDNFDLPPGPTNWFIIDDFEDSGPLGASFPYILSPLGVSDEIAIEVAGESVRSIASRSVARNPI